MGLSNLISKKAFKLQSLQTGFLYHYAFLMLVSTTFLISILNFEILTIAVLNTKIISLISVALFFLSKMKF
jgi:hypothetical protein